jgi:hypothetical protein
MARIGRVGLDEKLFWRGHYSMLFENLRIWKPEFIRASVKTALSILNVIDNAGPAGASLAVRAGEWYDTGGGWGRCGFKMP